MKASELRIGNWVKSNVSGNVLRFTTYQFNDLNEILSCSPPKPKLEPILLTEEWLVKFGFEKLWYDDNGMKLPYYRLNQNDYLFDLDYEFCATRDDAGYIYLKSVHQLQNLYFALTGEELEIK
jgi:hypothetical protein